VHWHGVCRFWLIWIALLLIPMWRWWLTVHTVVRRAGCLAEAYFETGCLSGSWTHGTWPITARHRALELPVEQRDLGL
jgi:hypothetical protein